MNGSAISRGVVFGALAMSFIVAISNYLVQFFVAGIDFASIGGLPFPSAFLTYAAFTYPISFLITDLSSRAMGPALSDDVFRYRWEGMLQAHGGNPYQARPVDPEWEHLRDDREPTPGER